MNEQQKNIIKYYIIDKGYAQVQKITDDDIKEMREKLDEREKELAQENKFSVITPEFSEWIVRTARDVATSKSIAEILNNDF